MASSRRTGTNENISTFGALGRDYTGWATWESATDNDLVTATTSEVLECYADDASFDTSANVAGATTSASYFRIIRAADGHAPGGIPGQGIHIISTTGLNCLGIAENYFQVQDVSIVQTVNSASTAYAININGNPSGVHCVGVLAKCLNAGAGEGNAFRVISTQNDNRFINCLAYKSKTRGFLVDGTGTKLAYNCTAIDNGTIGFFRNSGTLTITNCLAHGSGTNDFQGTMTASYNASEDATASGTGSRTSQTFTFVDSATDDWHLLYTDAGALGHGTDLSADATFAFDDDVDAAVIVDWSIGFDSDAQEPAATGGGTHLYRRRRR